MVPRLPPRAGKPLAVAARPVLSIAAWFCPIAWVVVDASLHTGVLLGCLLCLVDVGRRPCLGAPAGCGFRSLSGVVSLEWATPCPAFLWTSSQAVASASEIQYLISDIESQILSSISSFSSLLSAPPRIIATRSTFWSDCPLGP